MECTVRVGEPDVTNWTSWFESTGEQYQSVKGSEVCIAGRVGSAFAAELGTMQVSEQTDSLRVLGTDPVDYLVSPRVLACMIAGPVLNILCFAMGEVLTLLGTKRVDVCQETGYTQFSLLACRIFCIAVCKAVTECPLLLSQTALETVCHYNIASV